MTRTLVMMFIKGIFILVIFWLFAGMVYILWNWLMPEIFGLPIITFWQSCGLLLLTNLLFNFHNLKKIERKMNNDFDNQIIVD